MQIVQVISRTEILRSIITPGMIHLTEDFSHRSNSVDMVSFDVCVVVFFLRRLKVSAVETLRVHILGAE